jgi:hypothetical protein
MLPVDFHNLVHRNGALLENQHCAQSIGKVWIAGQIFPRSGRRCLPHTFHKADSGKRLREQQILDECMPRFVDIRINFVGDRRPGFHGKTHADVAADLTDKDRFVLKPHRTVPQAQVVSFVDTVARFLAREILVTTVSIKRTHRRIPVALTKKKRLNCFPHGCRVSLFSRKSAAAGERGGHIKKIADDHQVERISEVRLLFVTGTTGQILECRSQFILIQIHNFFF